MRNKFDEQLDNLNNELIKMGKLCEQAISGAIKITMEDDHEELKREVLEIDSEIDKKERDIESILYAFANKFLSGKDLERVKEELWVTEIGKSLIEEGKEEGIKAGEKKKAIEIA